MPASVTWPQYIRFVTAAFLTMFAGSQTVHHFYRPLNDLDDLVKAELDRILKEQSEKNVK